MPRDFFHMHFEREISLRHAVPAKRARWRRIRVHNVRVKFNVGRVVQPHAFLSRVARDRDRVTAIRARITQRVHFIRNHCTIAHHARFHAHAHRMTRTRVFKFFGTRIFVTHGATCRNRQMRGDIFDQNFLLAAESAADARLDYANAFRRQLQNGREHAARVKRHLR